MIESTSEFHGDLDLLGRINNALTLARVGQANYDPSTWYKGLEMLYCELTTEMIEEKRKDLRKQSTELAKKINTHLSRIQNPRIKGRYTITQELIDTLKDYEEELQEILKKSGLKMRTTKDSRAAFG